MKLTTRQADVIDSLSFQELCRFCQADEAWLIELVDTGVIEPQGSAVQNWRFRGMSITRAKKARRLNRDLGINTAGVAMVLELLEERDAILRRLARYESL